ncbi:hypothetical protein Rsub_09359 [Raphidocelis subcapitata]|uniref:RNA polymerase-associated protein n=1 Tax=Raphidocelis subcapitata TaxID=307507 RepID=A0A2V0PFC4_9CHLO|nr:hypothetical protein Rsub_09359 [Raphidocelis subcapitata]|eukprot:GBF96613.1 hypothetical protein Rsub_09359 [Raphidocelis subcapitata]
MASADQLQLPCQDGSIVVVDDLPDDVQGVVQFLESEAVPLQIWWDVARAYLAQGRTAQYLALLHSALEDDLLTAVEDYFKKRPTFEIVQLHCGLAAHHIEQFRLEADRAAKQQHLAAAAARVNTAKQEGPQEQLPFLAAGCLALAKGEANQALAEFRAAAQRRHNGRENASGLLGQACVHFGAGRYAEALEIYKAVLARNPSAPAEVRLGLAACFFRAGAMDRAQSAYERVLELDPSNADALLGLATLHLNGGGSVQQGLASALELLGRAFRADPGHPGVSVVLAHFLMLQGHHARALQLAEAAVAAADTDALRADAAALRARAAHALGRLQDAERGYAAAIRLDARAPLPRIGMAQAYLSRGEFINAASELESALSHAGPNIDALRLLGALAPELPDRVERRAGLFREAATRHPDDGGLLETLGELLAASDPKASLDAYEAALRAHRAGKGPGGGGGGGGGVPPRLLNNAAVLRYRSGQVGPAVELLAEAVAALAAGDGGLTPLQKVTLGYNMARLKEAAGDCGAAAEEYKRLLESFPSYTDCHLRLACLARAAGRSEEALEWAARAQAGAGGSAGAAADAAALAATLHLERGQYDACKKALDLILRGPGDGKANGAAAAAAGGGGGGGGGGHAPSDPYAKLAMAQLLLRTLPHGRTEAARARHKQSVENALGLYRSVLKAQPSNAFAANGLGVCLAEGGHLDAAREAFLAVQQAAVSSAGFMRLPDVYVNQGHVALAKQAYEQALALYDRAAAESHANDTQVLLYRARALYDRDDLRGARLALSAALHAAPGDPKLRFNLALVLQEWAVRVFKRQFPAGDESKLREYEAAAERLLTAKATFESLQAAGRPKTRIEPRKLQAHVEFCARTHALALQHVEAAERERNVTAAKRLRYEESLRAQEAARAEADLMAAAAEEARRGEIAARIQSQKQHLEAKLEDWKERKRMVVAAPDDEDGGGGGGGGGKPSRSGKKRRRKGDRGGAGSGGEGEGFLAEEEEEAAAGGSEEEEEFDEQAELKRAGLASDEDDGGSGSDGGGGGGGEGAPRARPAGRLRRRAAAAAAPDDGAGGGDASVEDLFGEDIFADPDEAAGEQAAPEAGQAGGDLADEDLADDLGGGGTPAPGGEAPGGGGGGGGGGGSGGGGGGSARKRARHGAAISDSEEEEDEGAPGGGGGGGGGGGE